MGKFRKIIEEKNITVYSLWDYSRELIKAGKEGWETNSKNIYFPFTNLNMYTITLVKYEPEEIKEEVKNPEVQELLAKVEEATGESQVGAAVVPEEDNVKPRRGRPAKS